MSNGRQVHFIDDGADSGLPVVFVGGLGTSVRVIRLLDFLRSMRVGLNIRMISVERNGYGQTAFDPELGMADFSAEVEAVLTHLGIDRFALFGISGGGPYVAKIASRNPSRVLSIHMAATSPALGQPARCGAASPASAYRDLLSQPMAFFGFPKDSPMHQVAGFQDTAFEEAARAHNARGQQADPAPLDHEIGLYCAEGMINNDEVSARPCLFTKVAPMRCWIKRAPKLGKGPSRPHPWCCERIRAKAMMCNIGTLIKSY